MNETGDLTHNISKNQFKMDQRFKYKSKKTIRLLQENMGVNLPNFGFGNGFLDITLNA